MFNLKQNNQTFDTELLLRLNLNFNKLANPFCSLRLTKPTGLYDLTFFHKLTFVPYSTRQYNRVQFNRVLRN